MRLLKELFDITELPRCALRNRTLLLQFVKRNIALRYRGSMLGLVWSFVQPLMMLCVYTFVFSVVFKARWGVDMGGGRGAFAIIMFCGMAIFNIFSESVNACCVVVTGNPNLVKKVIFPLEILPIAPDGTIAHALERALFLWDPSFKREIIQLFLDKKDREEYRGTVMNFILGYFEK